MHVQIAYVQRNDKLVPCHPGEVKMGDTFQLITGTECSPMMIATHAPYRRADDTEPGETLWVIPGEIIGEDINHEQ